MKAKRVLVAPLDWGLGHATRCIPIIQILLKKNIDVIIAGSGQSLQLLHQEFPQLKQAILPAYNPSYGYGSMVWQMARQLQKFIRVISEEHRTLQQIIVQEQIDIVISDNRYGCWSSKVPSYFITHQTTILMPHGWKWMSAAVNYFNTRQIKKFTACLVPDTDDHFLSGELSSNASLKINYIGALSRFDAHRKSDVKYDILILLSGPEPQRSVLENILLKQLSETNKKVFMIRGVREEAEELKSDKVEIVNFLNGVVLQNVIQQSDIVIARSGYSTVMDLMRLNSRAIFIPTPGQTEQEYLAHRLMKKGIAYTIDQDQIKLPQALVEAEKFTGFEPIHNELNRDLESLIENLIILP